jgi:hypothetical protein
MGDSCSITLLIILTVGSVEAWRRELLTVQLEFWSKLKLVRVPVFPEPEESRAEVEAGVELSSFHQPTRPVLLTEGELE